MTRKPDEIPAELMQPLATLPVFYELEGRRVVVAGGSDGAAWKADLAAAAGAEVEVFATELGAKLREIAAARANVRVNERAWRESDLEGAALALGVIADDEDARAFRDAARAAGAPVNLTDRPLLSDFLMGAIVNRSPLVIGVSTGGAAPVFAQAVRARLETLIPASFSAWARAAKAWRPAILESGLDFLARRDFWRRFTRLAFSRLEAAPTDADRAALLDETKRATQAPSRGRATLVGAGPGDPELLTLKALRVLADADVVLFDDLVPASVLDLARREARRINVGKRGHAPSVRQEEISALLVALGREGKNVVRLKGGDPMIFGRANEEIKAMRDAGLEVDVVPGVTAASAGAAAIRASLTSRDTARRVQFITAHSSEGDLPEDFDWGALADARATTAVYMGNRTLPALSRRLIAEGMDPQTPAVLIERATTPDERIVRGTIADLPEKVAQEELQGPCLVLIGAALAG
ncbi:MAG: uroporphyrinogen-III C-methyltransferase [Methylocystis sp.]|nr:uroporphyrinogen-III C-methyltransferase [Methylocystis sp.]MBI3275414.1 uroporphyrinogen-III C-methyltransferase [Methylocystis sp.]